VVFVGAVMGISAFTFRFPDGRVCTMTSNKSLASKSREIVDIFTMPVFALLLGDGLLCVYALGAARILVAYLRIWSLCGNTLVLVLGLTRCVVGAFLSVGVLLSRLAQILSLCAWFTTLDVVMLFRPACLPSRQRFVRFSMLLTIPSFLSVYVLLVLTSAACDAEAASLPLFVRDTIDRTIELLFIVHTLRLVWRKVVWPQRPTVIMRAAVPFQSTLAV
jgi:hypothetical protein